MRGIRPRHTLQEIRVVPAIESATVTAFYRFAVDQVGIARGHFPELTIIAILVLELVLFFVGIMT